MYSRILSMLLLLITIWVISSNGIINNSLYGQEMRIDKTGNNKFTKFEGETDLDYFVNEALTKNPSIKAQVHKAEAVRKRIPQAGTWMDPKLSLNIMNFPVSEFSFDLEPMTQ